jgi:hypothetical protein
LRLRRGSRIRGGLNCATPGTTIQGPQGRFRPFAETACFRMLGFQADAGVLNALPSVSTIQQGIGFGPETNTSGFGALLGLTPQPGALITADQRLLGLTPTPAPAPELHFHITAMDAKSFKDQAGNIADAMQTALQNGRPVATTIANRVRSI